MVDSICRVQQVDFSNWRVTGETTCAIVLSMLNRTTRKRITVHTHQTIINRGASPITLFLKSSWFRWLLFTVMMSFMFTRLYMAWGDPKAVGSVFRMMWIVSTTIAIGLGLYFKPRTWCTVCPMGSFQGVSSKNTYLLTVEDNCIQCKKCQRVCPISTYPGAYKQEEGPGVVPSIECLRCSNCVMNCPKKALHFAGG